MKVGDEVYLRKDPAVKGRITFSQHETGDEVYGDEIYYVNWSGMTSKHEESELMLASKAGHKNASILMEIAKEAAINPEYWKEFEFQNLSHGNWEGCSHSIMRELYMGYPVRRKLRTIRIGNYDVPEPIEIFTSDSDLCVRFDAHLDACAMQKALQELLGAKQ